MHLSFPSPLTSWLPATDHTDDLAVRRTSPVREVWLPPLTTDTKDDLLVATTPDDLHYGVSARTGWPDVIIL